MRFEWAFIKRPSTGVRLFPKSIGAVTRSTPIGPLANSPTDASASSNVCRHSMQRSR